MPITHKNKTEVIASLTSYPARFSSLHLTLKSLLQQTVSADQILLWIAVEDKSQLPRKVLQLAKLNQIEIHFTEDTRSYKKIIPALEKYPQACIVTFDDDVYYPPNTLQKLLEGHQKNPYKIIANRTHLISVDNLGNLQPYKQWHKNCSNQSRPERNFQTGVGGVLYPPNSLHKMVTDKNLFTKLAPHGDDIWLYWMMRLNGNTAMQTQNDFEFYHWPFSQKTALYKQNVRKDGNDTQIQAMLQQFGSPLCLPVNDD
ncbi:glycosyl transferase [Thiosulfatimonas sediminis]|uniref:Glycosyl transferase n=1 Tax=Thiosulfatimonas sediminis TaxID=2675054 RepID=A0A6F8PWX0_9GAMM|nr:glycosyltransferase [Thiosulfatimonas sediminis]BBP46621.1 glycosyl transferase [Thiosulfatimonas sediminis]